MPPLVHMDDVERRVRAVGDIGGVWRGVGEAAGTVGVGLRRIEIEPGRRSTPVHAHGAEEEIFYVLGGGGLLWQGGATCAVGPGDCIVHVAAGPAHTLIGGEQGLDVLAFGTRVPVEATHLPRAEAAWLWPTWVAGVGTGEHPYARDAAAGPLEAPAPGPRPDNVVALEDVEMSRPSHGSHSAARRDLGRAAGSLRSGLKWAAIDPGHRGAAMHCHSAEEELFVVLGGDGVLELGEEEHALRPGHVVARPPGTGVAHAFRAGEGGLTLLCYGTREPNDICWYPRSNKIFWRGVGVIARVERLGYWDGEE